MPYFTRVDPSGRRDQEVCRQPQGTSGRPQAQMAVRHTAHRSHQGLEAHEAERGSNPEFLVKAFFGSPTITKGTSFWYERIDFGEERKTITSLMPAQPKESLFQS